MRRWVRRNDGLGVTRFLRLGRVDFFRGLAAGGLMVHTVLVDSAAITYL